MTMTRKHFREVAETLRIEIKYAPGPEARQAIIRVAGALASDFKQFNIHFDRQRFMDAVLADAGTDTEKAHQASHPATTVNYGSM